MTWLDVLPKENPFIWSWWKLTCCVIGPFGVIPEQHIGTKWDAHCTTEIHCYQAGDLHWSRLHDAAWQVATSSINGSPDCSKLLLAPSSIWRTSRSAKDFGESTCLIEVWCLYPQSLMALINSGELSVYRIWTWSFDPMTWFKPSTQLCESLGWLG